MLSSRLLQEDQCDLGLAKKIDSSYYGRVVLKC